MTAKQKSRLQSSLSRHLKRGLDRRHIGRLAMWAYWKEQDLKAAHEVSLLTAEGL